MRLISEAASEGDLGQTHSRVLGQPQRSFCSEPQDVGVGRHAHMLFEQRREVRHRHPDRRGQIRNFQTGIIRALFGKFQGRSQPVFAKLRAPGRRLFLSLALRI